MDTLRKYYEALDEVRQENQDGLFEIIGMKNERLSYQEARIEALEKHIEKLNIEILNLQYQLKVAQNAINE